MDRGSWSLLLTHLTIEEVFTIVNGASKAIKHFIITLVEKNWSSWWKERTKREFKYEIPTAAPHLSEFPHIYRQLKRMLTIEERGLQQPGNPYKQYDPALFQQEYDEKKSESPDLPSCLEKAILVGNFPLIKNLMSLVEKGDAEDAI